MTTQSLPISGVSCVPTHNPDMEDDMSTTTPPFGYQNSEKDKEFISKTIRLFFAPTDRTRVDSVDPSDIHIQWMRMISSTFGFEVKYINNNSKPVINIDLCAKTTKPISYKQQFKGHEKPMGVTATGTPKVATPIIHRILTRVPLGQIKRHPTAFKCLKDNNCFLREHLWDEQEWDVQQIGFVTGYNPKYFTPEKTNTSVRTRIRKALRRAKVPKFHMVLKTHKITYQGRTSSTQAFAPLEVPISSVSQLLLLIKDVTIDTKEFVSFRMRHKNPEAFQGANQYQNHILANQHVVMVNYVGTEAMYYLSDRIKVIPGVKDIIPIKKVTDNGKFYILVDKMLNQVFESH
jgi:hypothetical protein